MVPFHRPGRERNEEGSEEFYVVEKMTMSHQATMLDAVGNVYDDE